MRYVFRCAENMRKTVDAKDENLLRRRLSWQCQVTTVGGPQALRWRLETSDVHIQAVAVTQIVRCAAETFPALRTILLLLLLLFGPPAQSL